MENICRGDLPLLDGIVETPTTNATPFRYPGMHRYTAITISMIQRGRLHILPKIIAHICAFLAVLQPGQMLLTLDRN